MDSRCDMLDGMMDKIARQISRSKDDFLFGCFERHGYSREKVLELIRENRVMKIEHGFFVTFIVDDEPVFRIENCPIVQDFENHKITYEIREVPIEEVQNVNL